MAVWWGCLVCSKNYTIAVVPELLGVSIYDWLPMVVPPLLLALVMAVWRTRVWALLIAFSWSAAGTAVAECVYDTLIAKRFDQKFQYAPAAALELSLLGAAGIVAIGLLLFGLVLAGKKELRAKLPIWLAGVVGALYTTVPWLLLR